MMADFACPHYLLYFTLPFGLPLFLTSRGTFNPVSAPPLKAKFALIKKLPKEVWMGFFCALLDTPQAPSDSG